MTLLPRLLALILALYCVQLGGCQVDVREAKKEIERQEAYSKPLGTTIADLRQERDDLEDRLQRVNHALKTASDDAIQFKIWLGVGACGLAALVLIAIGIWTTRRILVELGLVCIGLAGLGAVAAWLVPYILWIGLAIALIAIAATVYMLANREKALKQVTGAVDTAKDRIPEFAENYRNIFREHIDSGMEKVVDAVRGVKS